MLCQFYRNERFENFSDNNINVKYFTKKQISFIYFFLLFWILEGGGGCESESVQIFESFSKRLRTEPLDFDVLSNKFKKKKNDWNRIEKINCD